MNHVVWDSCNQPSTTCRLPHHALPAVCWLRGLDFFTSLYLFGIKITTYFAEWYFEYYKKCDICYHMVSSNNLTVSNVSSWTSYSFYINARMIKLTDYKTVTWSLCIMINCTFVALYLCVYSSKIVFEIKRNYCTLRSQVWARHHHYHHHKNTEAAFRAISEFSSSLNVSHNLRQFCPVVMKVKL